ncbi:TetR/AcrR family transcriptional regulator [Nocardia sp. NPDC050175]|uniref:TetR/AcrR family transcriptional regulator n=1 Tax=Nocardia sp. NPDC050175 TaxID=3364317 RepID=UPI003798C312
MTRATSAADGPGRAAQRRRTRNAIVEATMALISEGGEPSVNDIAVAAEVSRRTVYLHFPSLDQLMLDATLGLLSSDTDAILDHVTSTDPRVRVAALTHALGVNIVESLPLGRRLVKLTIEAAPPAPDTPRRGYRRVRWIEWALAPIRDRMTAPDFDELVSAVATVVGWEAFMVLIDIRALPPERAVDLCARTATTLVDAAIRALDHTT